MGQHLESAMVMGAVQRECCPFQQNLDVRRAMCVC